MWLLAVLAMLPYPLSSLGRAYWAQSARADIAADAAAVSGSVDPSGDVAQNDMPAAATPAPDTRLWSDSRKDALARLLPAAPARVQGLLLLPGQEQGIAVYDGATEAHMTLGAGRLVETSPLPGDGNIALSAHRDGAFRALKDLVVGDRVRLRTSGGERVFEVSTLSVVDPDAVHVLDPTGHPTLTLITCYPFYFIGSAPKRYVVQARLLRSEDARLLADDSQPAIRTALRAEQTKGAR